MHAAHSRMAKNISLAKHYTPLGVVLLRWHQPSESICPGERTRSAKSKITKGSSVAGWTNSARRRKVCAINARMRRRRRRRRRRWRRFWRNTVAVQPLATLDWPIINSTRTSTYIRWHRHAPPRICYMPVYFNLCAGRSSRRSCTLDACRHTLTHSHSHTHTISVWRCERAGIFSGHELCVCVCVRVLCSLMPDVTKSFRTQSTSCIGCSMNARVRANVTGYSWGVGGSIVFGYSANVICICDKYGYIRNIYIGLSSMMILANML